MTEKVTVVIDTREQESYTFPAERFVTVRRALPTGDYSLVGLEHDIAVERKSAEDFIHTVIRDRERFRRELVKLAGYDRACVVVESGLDDILAGAYRSGAHPSSVVGAALSIIVDYGIPVYFCSNRQCACRFVEEYLLRYHRRSLDLCRQQQQTISESEERSSESTSHPQTSLPDSS
jgi:ERCC4-type nuclease